MLWPYDEVEMALHPEPGTTTVKAPWLEATVATDALAALDLQHLSTGLSNQSLTQKDLGLVNRFFSNLADYPFCYTLPLPKGPNAQDRHALLGTSPQHDMQGAFAQFANSCLELGLDFRANDLNDLLSALPRSTFEWDAEAALAFAGLGDAVHPESVFSVVRRYHLLEVLNSDQGSQTFEQTQRMDDREFEATLCMLLRANHYVTEKCQQALLPALSLAQSARGQVEAFRNEEQGHDKLLERAISSLGAEVQKIQVSVCTRALMGLLEYCAHRNFLAFCIAVDMFERSNYSETDPLAALLQSRGFEKAASYINAHMKINDHGNHENVAQKFLFAMAPCPKDYVLEAIQLAEMLSLVMCSINRPIQS